MIQDRDEGWASLPEVGCMNLKRRRKTMATSVNEVRFTLPPKLLQIFSQEPRVVIKYRPDGLMPIDTIIINQPELLQKLVATPEFKKEFEVVIMRR